ncbi:MAG: hypothetical protein N2C12_18050 [Planctomycetales bacterium]
MIQGDLQGQLQWNEIFRMSSYRISNVNTGLILHVEGSHIEVKDIYEISIDRINQIIQRHR